MNEIERLLYGRKGSKKKPMDLFGNSKKQINFGFNNMGIFRDSDRDGVIDVLDCRPHNPKRQHIRPSHAMRERLKELPVYVTTEEEEDEEATQFHIMSKKARKKAPKVRRRILSAIKKHPQIVGDIEKTKPRRVIYHSAPDEDETLAGTAFQEHKETMEEREKKGKKTAHVIIVYPPEDTRKKRKIKRRIKEAIKKEGATEEQAEKYAMGRIKTMKSESDQLAVATAHELRHVRQYRKEREIAQKVSPKAAERYSERRKRGSYVERVEERQAREAGRKSISKRERVGYGTRKHFTRQLTRTLGETPEDEREKRRLI